MAQRTTLIEQAHLLKLLRPGDLLFYQPDSIFGWLISVKTWSPACHVETYVGDCASAASRDGRGVGTYALRFTGLFQVRHPKAAFDMDTALHWHQGCAGQRYDWKGLLVFYLAAKQSSPDRMFCSEHATRFARWAGIDPFAPDYDADRVSPGMLLASTAYERVWPAPTFADLS